MRILNPEIDPSLAKNHVRDAILRLLALRDGRTYESVLREYRGIPDPLDPRIISSGMYVAVETTIAYILAGPEPKEGTPNNETRL